MWRPPLEGVFQLDGILILHGTESTKVDSNNGVPRACLFHLANFYPGVCWCIVRQHLRQQKGHQEKNSKQYLRSLSPYTWYDMISTSHKHLPVQLKSSKAIQAPGKTFYLQQCKVMMFWTTSGEFDWSGFPPWQLSAFPPPVFWRQEDLRAR